MCATSRFGLTRDLTPAQMDAIEALLIPTCRHVIAVHRAAGQARQEVRCGLEGVEVAILEVAQPWQQPPRGRSGAHFADGDRGSIWTVAVIPATSVTPSGTWSISMRTGTRWARRTQV